MCSLFRFTADVRSVLSRNLHQHRLWWSSDGGLSSSPFFFCFVLSNCFPIWHPPDHSPSTLDSSPSKNGLTWGLSGGESILNSKEMEKANFRMLPEAFFACFFFPLLQNGVSALQFYLCWSCASYVCAMCVWGHLLFFFLIIWRYGVAGYWSKIKTDLFMTCVFNSSLGRHTSLLKVVQTEIY